MLHIPDCNGNHDYLWTCQRRKGLDHLTGRKTTGTQAALWHNMTDERIERYLQHGIADTDEGKGDEASHAVVSQQRKESSHDGDDKAYHHCTATAYTPHQVGRRDGQYQKPQENERRNDARHGGRPAERTLYIV